MTRNTILLICLLVFFKPGISVAQQYFVKSYAAENGLPTRIISGACQDKDGFMWFATYSGISKYDGFSFSNYDSLNGLSAQHYRKIKCDERGVIWAVPFSNTGNIVYFKNDSWKTIDLTTVAKPYSYLTSFDIFYINNRPVICIGSYNGADVFRDNKWKHYAISKTQSLNVVYNVIAKNGSFYLSTKIGLCVLTGETLSWELNKKISKINEAVAAVTFENPGTAEEKMWILGKQSITFFQHDKLTLAADNFILEDVDVAHFPFLEISKSGNLVFGNNFSKYLLITSTSQVIPLKVKNGFSSNGASSVFIDREENMWFTDSRGIDKISNILIVNYFESNGLPENEVASIIETNDGRFVLGHNNRISILHDNKFKIIDLPGRQNSLTRVLDIMKDREGNIWFSANNLGVGKLTADGRIQWYTSGDGFRSTSICQDNSGKIWIGSNSKLYYLKGSKVVEYEHNEVFLNSGIRKVFPDDKGGIYITGINGLWHVNNNTVQKIKTEDETIPLSAFSYLKDKNGTEFVGTMNGLYFIEKGVIKRFRNQSLNLTNPIYFILQDNENFYWFGTNNGVYRWDGINDPEIFNTSNGLAGRETNRSAGMLDSKGRVWIGTDRGLSCFTPGNDRLKTPAPQVKLLYTETNRGIRYPLNEISSIMNNSNTLTFHFRGISFVNEELLIYKYKLEGYDKDWREATQSMLDKITYIDIKPGTYVFCVMAKNYSSSWSAIAYSEKIRIKHPFYLSWWFISLSVLAFLALLWAFYKIISQQLINTTLKQEISDRIMAQESLKESEQRMSFVLEGSRLGTWDWDISNNQIQRNELWSGMLGYTLAEMEQSQTQWIDLVHPDDKEKVQADLKNHMEGKTPLFEVSYRMRTKINGYKWIHDRAMIVQYDASGKPLRMSGTHTDINDRKMAEDALQKSEERLRLLLASLPVVIFIASVDGNFGIEMVAGNVETLTGYTEHEFLSGSRFWNRLHPDDIERVKTAFISPPSAAGITIEYRWQLADGSYKWFHNQTILTTNAYRNEYLGVFVDINDRKLAEQQIKDKNDQLNLINAEKDKLFSIISHDLRSPVSGFLGLTSLLTEELGRLKKEQIGEIAVSLFHSATKVNDLLNDLLEWSQLQRGLTVFNPVSLPIKLVVDDCVALFEEQANTKNIEVINQISTDMKISADTHMVQVVLRNLLTNALKFTPKRGKVIISATIGNNQFVRISVSDTGIGMDSELAGKVFKVNEKTSRKGTDGEPSSGLGLILCKEFVEKQNGSIWVESVEGKGSTFHFTMPCV